MTSLTEPYALTKRHFAHNGLVIRPADASDFNALVEMMFIIYDELCPRLSSWYKNHPEAFETEFHGPRNQDPSKRVFYAIQNSNSRIAGSGGIVQHDPEKAPNIGELADIYLLADYRGKGLGETLVKDLIRKGRKMDFDSIYLTTRLEFEAATRLYQKLGFVEVPNKKYRSSNSLAFELSL